MRAAETRNTDLLEPMLARYKAEGFDVFVRPSAVVLPPFMQDYRPDAVAIRPDKKIAFMVTRSEDPAAAKIKRLRELLSDQPDWELVVLYVSPNSSAARIPIAARGAIQKAAVEVGELKSAGQAVAALVMGWATLEAIARVLLPDRLARSQPPERLIEVLASEGYIVPNQADLLRATASARNAAAHGQIDVIVEPKQLETLVSTLRALTKLLPKDAA